MPGHFAVEAGGLDAVLDEVRDEVLRAAGKHGAECMAAGGHSAGKRLGILGEEAGEAVEAVEMLAAAAGLSSRLGAVCRATTYDNLGRNDLRTELIQTAAMAAAWAYSIDQG